MKRAFIGLILCCLIPVGVGGQNVSTVSEESLLNIETARKTDRSGGIYTGTPFVRIDSVSDRSSPATEWDKTKMRLFGTTDILKSDQPTRTLKNTFSVPKLQPKTTEIRATVTPAFGKAWTTPLTSHTGDRSMMLQLTPTGDIIVKETIQTVQGTQDSFFTRTFPKQKDLDTPEILYLTQDKKSMSYTVTETADTLVIKGKDPLSAGEHRFELTYKLPRVLRAASPTETFGISLTGPDWPLVTERFSGVLLMPEQVRVHTAQIGFGTNNLILPQGAVVNTDAKGNIFFQTTHLLPAFSDVRLNVSLDSTFLQKRTLTDWLDDNPAWVAVLLWTLLLVAYATATIITLRPTKKQNTALFLTKISPIYLAALLNRIPDPSFWEQLTLYEKCRGGKGRLIAFWRWIYTHRIGILLMRMGLAVRLVGTHVGELTLLTLIFVILTAYLDLSLTLAAWGIVCLTTFITLMALIPALKKQRQHRLTAIMTFLSDENMAFGQSKESFKKLFTRLYPYLLATKRLKNWTNQFQHHNLSEADFCFLASPFKEDT